MASGAPNADLAAITDDLERLATRLIEAPIDPLLHPTGEGLVHNPRLAGGVSSSSTAAFLRARRQWPRLGAAVTASQVKQWTDGVRARWAGQLTTLSSATDPSADRTVDAAYRLAYTHWAMAEPAPGELSKWAEDYCRSWLLRTHPRLKSMYLLHLVSRLGPAPTLRPLLQAIAEEVVWRQLAAAAHEHPVDFDPIELVLALTLAGGSVPGRDFRLACDVLNDSAAHTGTWRVTPNPTLPSCSALYAVLAWIESFGQASPTGATLLDSIVAHAQWLIASGSDKTWLVSDLTHRLPDPEPWFSFLAIEFAHSARTWLRNELQRAVLRVYSVQQTIERPIPWGELLIEAEARDALARELIEPAKLYTSGTKLPRCTALMFGPPGTAKTTIAESIAAELKWPLVEIGVSDFLAQGIDGVFAQSKTIFDHLLLLERAVVLLDEVEGVFANREGGDAEAFQKLLTSSLLPPLKRLRDKAALILLIATNHIDGFDAAVRRPGRIDLVIPVGPPNRDGRIRLLERHGVLSAVSHSIAARLKDQVTIGELSLVKRFPSGAKADLGAFLTEWQRVHRDVYLISDAQLKSFTEDSVAHKRLE